MVGQVKSHFLKQLLEGNLLAFEEPQHPLLCHQKVDQVCLDALRVVHIVDILVPGAGVADEPVVKLRHLAVVPVQLGDEAVVHTVDADGLGQALLGADEDGIVVVLKPPVNQVLPLPGLHFAAGDGKDRTPRKSLPGRLSIRPDDVVLPHPDGHPLVGDLPDFPKDGLQFPSDQGTMVVPKDRRAGADAEHDLDLGDDPGLGQFPGGHGGAFEILLLQPGELFESHQVEGAFLRLHHRPQLPPVFQVFACDLPEGPSKHSIANQLPQHLGVENILPPLNHPENRQLFRQMAVPEARTAPRCRADKDFGSGDSREECSPRSPR